MLSRGIKIAERLAVLDKMIAPEGGTSAAEEKANSAIDLQDQANKVRGGAVWMNMLLIGMEGARSFGLWCFVIWSTAARSVAVDPNVFRDLQRDADELARRKANLGEGAEKAVKTKTRKKNREQSLKLLADHTAESVKREEMPAEPTEAVAEVDEGEVAEEVPADEPDAPPAENDDAPDEQEKAA